MPSRRVLNTPTTGVFPPFDSDFARAVRQNLDSLSDQDLGKRIAEMADSPHESVRQSRIKLLLEQKRRREERQLKAQVRFLENYGCGPDVLKQIGEISLAEATEITKRFFEKWPKLKILATEMSEKI